MAASCADRRTVTHHGQAVTLGCSIEPAHPGTHQCYHGDHLYEWPHIRGRADTAR